MSQITTIGFAALAMTVVLAAVMLPGVVHADDEPEPRGVVVTIGEDDGAVALGAAREAGGAVWRPAAIAATNPPPVPGPEAAVEALRGFYLDADFLRCLSQLNDRTLDRTALLSNGHLDAAAAVGIYGGACALGAADTDLAASLLREVAVAELPATAALEVVSPDVQRVAEEERRAVAEADRVTVRVTSQPAGAAVAVDGGGRRCAATPCELSLTPGEHVFVVEALGFARRTERRDMREDASLELALDPAPSDVVTNQLAHALGREVPPDDALFVRATSRAFGARLVVLSFERGGRHHAALYDRASGHIVAEASVANDEGPEVAVGSVVNEWRGQVESTPFYQHPLFWIATVGAAIAAGVIVFLVVAPPDPRHDIVFGN